MQDHQANETFFVDTIDSHTIRDLLANGAGGGVGGIDGTSRPISGMALATDDLNLEDILGDQDNSLGELDRYDYPNAGSRLIIDHDGHGRNNEIDDDDLDYIPNQNLNKLVP